jgi:hypothetical protein
VAYESRKLTAAEQTYLPHVLELLSCCSRWSMPCWCFATTSSTAGHPAPRPPGVLSEFHAANGQPGDLVATHRLPQSGTWTALWRSARRDRGVPLRFSRRFDSRGTRRVTRVLLSLSLSPLAHSHRGAGSTRSRSSVSESTSSTSRARAASTPLIPLLVAPRQTPPLTCSGAGNPW